MDENQIFGWDEVGYVADDVNFDVLPEGEYAFEVRKVMYQKYQKRNDASTIPDHTPYANVQLHCTSDMANGTAFEKLYLYSAGMGRISTFFKSIGMLPADSSANDRMPASFKQMFDGSVTMTGRCKITIRTYKDKDGKEQKANNIRFLVPESGASPAPAYQQPNTFQPQPQPTYQQQPQIAQQPMAQPQPTQQQSWGGSWS